MDAKGVPSKDTGRIQIGISVHGYAGIVLDAVVAVDEIADAARGREQLQHTTNGIGPIEPVLVVAVFAPRAVMLVMPESKVTWKISQLILLVTSNQNILGELIVRISLG